MKPHLSFAILSIALSFASAADEVKSVVRFANGDQLSGSLESLTTERLVWKSPILEKPTPFFLKSVLDLTLSASPPKIEAKHEATISLTNGDSVRGQLASVGDDAVELDTWFAGRMKFRRVMISSIRVDERTEFVYQGPTGLDGWKQSGGNEAWSFQDSALRSNAAGSIARNVGLPDECSIAFDVAWRNQIGLRVFFFSDDIDSDSPSTGYDMTFQSRAISLRNCETQRSVGRTPNAISLQENEKARIEIRASVKSGNVSVLVDGKTIENWNDPDFARKKIGRGIHFVSMNSSPLRISHIEVGSWDGVTEAVPQRQPLAGIGMPAFGGQDIDGEEASAPEEKSNDGRMMLRNGDSIDGQVLSITGDMITIKTPFKEVRIPVEMLKSVALKPVDPERCKRENGDVRGWFPDGSSLVFRLEAVGDGTLSGTNQNFGAAQFKTAAFSRIEFNIYDPKLVDLRNAGGW